MTPEQRKRASIDLTLTYFQSYYTEWRLAKVLTTKKLIETRHDFYEDLLPEIGKWSKNDGSASVAQEIHNGLHHDAIAQCIQYIEDLFALIRATKQPDYFVKNIVTYGAGSVTNTIKSYNANLENVSKDFYLPNIDIMKDDSRIVDAVNQLTKLVEDQVKFYKKYWFFYNQYKHGLAIPMRPYGNIYTKEQIELDKKGEMEPFIVVYDNLNISAAASKGTFSTNHGAVMPGFTNNVMPFISKLEKESNFLRLVFPPDIPNFNIELLLDQAYKTRACISVLIANYTNHISPQGTKRVFRLPLDYRKNEALECGYEVEDE